MRSLFLLSRSAGLGRVGVAALAVVAVAAAAISAGLAAPACLADPAAPAAPAASTAPAQAAAAPVAAAPGDKIGRRPHLEFDVVHRWVRVECESLAVNAPLEFYCCLDGTNEHESVLRSGVRPSDLHIALLAIGLKPGAPITYSEAAKRWLPPHGPPLDISVEFDKGGKTVRYPAYRWLRDVKSKKECKGLNWVFCGSRVMKDGRYAADDTGYIMTIVNFDFAVIDISEFASSNNDLLDWERNPDLMPPKGTKVWLVIEPVGNNAVPPAPAVAAGGSTVGGAAEARHVDPLTAAIAGGEDRPAAMRSATGSSPPATRPTTGPAGPEDAALSAIQSVKTDDQKIQSMLQYEDRVIGPRARAMREAAEAHYKVIESLRKEQQRLISEADLIQRAIDEMEKRYQDLTTPQPADEPAPAGAPPAGAPPGGASPGGAPPAAPAGQPTPALGQ